MLDEAFSQQALAAFDEFGFQRHHATFGALISRKTADA